MFQYFNTSTLLSINPELAEWINVLNIASL